ncbi:MAG: hypothetical protein HOC91_03675 [Nitrospinaceae bacterium]|nr:hypothetical protein [Nitrospinaceae bacterium]MBT3435333.1 hypothetical protein [Nitrospinaceae bacterium]MBT4429592.1 hypothetical protein [Nitrospinaceae bacterium]MBT5948836.1 hypothetical protein [Nitrospinaceae bacterium]MBT6393189.1 hypothetical protein [Nitrospinaceae bacterium]
MPNFEKLRVENDIAEEMANTLGRVGRRFPIRLREAWSAMAAWENCPGSEGGRKEALEEVLHRAMDQAEKARYHLIVQREAMGLREHTEVARKFPMPVIAGRPPAAGDPTIPRLSFAGGFLRARRRKTSE